MKNLFYSFFELIYPPLCAGCDDGLLINEEILCTSCLVNLPKADIGLLTDNELEKRFYGKVKVDHAFVFLKFQKKSIVQNILFEIKYEGNKAAGRFLGKKFGWEILKKSPDFKPDLIAPVPLHSKRLKSRRYNQSFVIGEGLGESLGVCCKEVVGRVVSNSTQTKISRILRWKNVDGIFKVKDDSEVSGKHILLIDDVVTTGSTMEACLVALLEAGASKVSIASVAIAT
ncbi:MAG: ComF family protein [Sporocytophaga sp.]|uniref:ComF family protein n=1 Tax=Sporocytophaga sp. TaxID=2231183 RepID=UPI001AFD1490|nr:phosphoribosyltransferase family protein [Sporocytophaga sp.]MBO9698597.1 ComF family protein [Sporocytophaga sp.]